MCSSDLHWVLMNFLQKIEEVVFYAGFLLFVVSLELNLALERCPQYNLTKN